MDNNTVKISWLRPSSDYQSDYGSALFGFAVYIKTSTQAFAQDVINCDGSSAGVIANNYCFVPMATLKAAPFNLLTGDSVVAKVVNYNAVGNSLDSS